ncbi:MAG: helix-turn-helix transcriptional regulator [Candidatus Omnitrophica bacterium]|nr:helix-turn-helix transcriptional regulator [Candidatus Omnitrophota bacterium]
MDAAALKVRERIERLTALRHRLGWSEETCAHHLGVTYSTLNRWERGSSWPKSQVVLKAIDHFLAKHERQKSKRR